MASFLLLLQIAIFLYQVVPVLSVDDVSSGKHCAEPNIANVTSQMRSPANGSETYIRKIC
jgi:hypothetical protein